MQAQGPLGAPRLATREAGVVMGPRGLVPAIFLL